MLTRFFDELKRRRVPQVAGFYLAAGWLTFEVSEAAFPRLGLPDWTVTLVLVLLLLAFPLVVGLAWLYDVTPTGVLRTDSPEAGARADTSSRPATGRSAFPGRSLAIGAILVLVVAAGAFILARGGGADATLSTDPLVVFPFTVRGGEDVEVLAEGMVELLSAKLDGVGELRSTAPHAVLALAGGSVDAGEASSLARRLGAGHYVLGSVLEFGGELRLDASIYRTEDPAEPVARASVEGDATSFLGLVDELAGALLTSGDLAPPGRLTRIAAMTTEELPALKLFLQGERALRATSYAAAIERFERAIEVDSTFSLAYYRLAVAALWLDRHELVHRSIDSALRNQQRLSERDRALLSAFAARQMGRNAEAERRYRAIVASYPSDVEAWYELGEVLFHNGGLLGVPLSELSEPFERTLALDPGHGAALFHLTNTAAWTRDTTLLRSATQAYRERRGGDKSMPIEGQWAFAMGDQEDRTRMIEEMVAGDLQTTFGFAALATEDPGDMRQLLAAAQRVSPGPYLVDLMGNLAAGFGLRDEALTWLERQEEVRSQPPIRTAFLATYPFLRSPSERLEGLRARILDADPGPLRVEPLSADEWSSHDVVRPQLRLYTLALLDHRLGRPGEALRRADDLEVLGGPPEVRSLAADLARHVRAQVHFDQGRTAEALRLIEGATLWEVSPWDERTSAIFSGGALIVLRAEALHELGRHREAIRWYSTAMLGPYTSAYSHYRRAQAYEALGETDRAAEHYGTFLRVWTEADPNLQVLVDDARRSLLRLSPEGTP